MSAEPQFHSADVSAPFTALLGSAHARPVDPVSFVLPDDTAYRAELEMGWGYAHDLLGDRRCLVPRDLLVTPGEDGVLREVDTNGLASGNTALEAVIHAICEVVERDAASQHELFARFGWLDRAGPPSARVDLNSLPPSAAEWLERLRRHDLDLVLEDITTDIAIATFRTTLSDPHYPSEAGPQLLHFVGFGCHPDAEVALMRSLTEAVQSRVGFVHGGRDSFNELGQGRAATQLIRERSLRAPKARPFAESYSVRHADLTRELEHLLAVLTSAGIEQVLVASLTRPELEVPVVRVRIPGLATFMVNRRRVGERELRFLI